MDEKIKERLVKKFRERAATLRRASIIVMALILLLFGGGIYLFVFSGSIAINEIASLKVTFKEAELAPTPIVDRSDSVSEFARKLEKKFQELEAKVDSARNRQASQIYLVSTVTTRIGSVLILLFLVQILVTLYRYNTRLAVYHDARADGLELISGDSASEIEKTVRVL